jgi:putative alpha-1,2-mannosidase
MRELYTPHTFPGDEDTGSMAAWFIFSSLGFYPACPGKPDYTLGCAFFPRATLHLPNSKTLVIETSTSAPSKGLVELNGGQLKDLTISHTLILAGGHLRFT